MQNKSCDIFCAVVDNYGDIGVSWRLANSLAHEHGVKVRLWVDDLVSFSKLCPEVNTTQDEQVCRGVVVRLWRKDFPEIIPADLVVEAFACKLPESYVEAMAVLKCPPVWLNLEYLSAEDWVEGAHRLPSPHLQLPLTKHFFFPGFTAKTGGVLIEHDLLARRDLFQSSSAAQQAFWHSMNVPARIEGELRISLFSYENAALVELLKTWERSDTLVVCCVPEGRVLPQIQAYFAGSTEPYARGNLKVYVLPFVEQERYDELLWACDVNFVRGEDSCVRAQWAGKPFVWHIYPQHDGVHMQKLNALSALYGKNLAEQAALANASLWQAWNGQGDVAHAWAGYMASQVELEAHAKSWAQALSSNDLALNLLDFYREVANS